MTVKGEGVTEPKLGVTGREWNLGTAAVGVLTEGTFFMSNDGGGTLTGTISVASPFSVTPSTSVWGRG